MVCLMVSTTKLVAQVPRSILIPAKWINDKGTSSLTIDVTDIITPAQKEIVNSGFSTFTLLAISDQSIQPRDALPDQRVVCSVKYDTWEERYQAVRVEPLPIESSSIKDYVEWSKKCLQIRIDSPTIVRKVASGGQLSGLLQIRQSSPDESAKIKKWLVQQQSGFMQGLYAHMLGDFQFQGIVKLDIIVPPQGTASRGARDKTGQVNKKDGN